MFERRIGPFVEDALGDTPAVLLVGARQTGKTTLVRSIARTRPGSLYLTFDDTTAVEAATADPDGFVAGLPGSVILDEIQRVPGILPALKMAIDRRRQPGRFLLTGSADVLSLPRVSESLAGRVEIATLWPLSQGEISGVRERFIDELLRGERPSPPRRRADVPGLVVRGGYPESVARPRPERRRAFFESYVTTLIARDVKDIASIDAPGSLRRLLQLAAARTAGVLNHAELSRTVGLPASTLKRYLAMLSALFLVRELPAWSSNRGKRLARGPKLHVVDTGLAAALLGLEERALERERTQLGPLLESFVVSELEKQAGWSTTRVRLHHFRTHTGQEVDVVLEDPRGRVVGIEVKASSTVVESDLKGLRALAEAAGSAFVQGIVLHLGKASVPFGKNLLACPVDVLWGE